MIIKTIINLVELYILVKILYKTTCFFFRKKSYGKYKSGKSIAGKIGLLLSNRIHDLLDNMIKKQKNKRPATNNEQTKNDTVEFKVYKFTKAN